MDAEVEVGVDVELAVLEEDVFLPEAAAVFPRADDLVEGGAGLSLEFWEVEFERCFSPLAEVSDLLDLRERLSAGILETLKVSSLLGVLLGACAKVGTGGWSWRLAA